MLRVQCSIKITKDILQGQCGEEQEDYHFLYSNSKVQVVGWFPVFVSVFLHWGLCTHASISILVISKFCMVGVVWMNNFESHFAYNQDSTNVLNCGWCSSPKAYPQHPLITGITNIWLTSHKMCLFPLLTIIMRQIKIQTLINVMYIYTHTCSVYSMMVCVLITCVRLSCHWGLEEGVSLTLLGNSCFCSASGVCALPLLTCLLSLFPHLLFITTLPCCRLRQRTFHWFCITQALKPAL